MRTRIPAVLLTAAVALSPLASPIATAATPAPAHPATVEIQDKIVWIVSFKKENPDGSIGIFDLADPRFETKDECEEWRDEDGISDHPEWLASWCQPERTEPSVDG